MVNLKPITAKYSKNTRVSLNKSVELRFRLRSNKDKNVNDNKNQKIKQKSASPQKKKETASTKVVPNAKLETVKSKVISSSKSEINKNTKSKDIDTNVKVNNKSSRDATAKESTKSPARPTPGSNKSSGNATPKTNSKSVSYADVTKSKQALKQNGVLTSNRKSTTIADGPKPQAASPQQVRSSADIYDIVANSKPGSSHEGDTSRYFTHKDWCLMKEGLLNKILEQEIELNQLRERVSTYEVMLKSFEKVQHETPALPKPPIPLATPAKSELCGSSCHLIGESHVRSLASELSSMMPRTCRIEGTFMPGVGFHGLANQHEQFPNLVTPAKEDCVVIMCGTNDVCSTDWNTIQDGLDVLITKFSQCKLLCAIGVPPRQDNRRLNFHIKRFNLKLRGYLSSKLSNLHFLDPIKFIKPKDYRLDGVHFNKSGKSKLCRRIQMAMEKYTVKHEVRKTLALSDLTNEDALPSSILPLSNNSPSYEDCLFSGQIEKVTCDDLIDLTDPPQLAKEREESDLTRALSNTVLFSDTFLSPFISNAESVNHTPYSYSTPCFANNSDKFYRLTHISLNSSLAPTSNSTFSTTIQPTVDFQNLNSASVIN